MKLISCMVLVCVFFLTDAGRVRNNDFEISNGDMTSDVIKNKRQKRHPRYWNRELDMNYINLDQRINVLEAKFAAQDRYISELLSRPYLPPKVYVVQASQLPSENETTNLISRFNGDRPISFNGQPSSQDMPIQPPVKHEILPEITTSSPNEDRETCFTSILICCYMDKSEIKECFKSFNCPNVYNSPYACHKMTIQKIISDLKAKYAPDSD